MSKRKDVGWQQAGGIMESKNENVKVPLISKIAYGFGDVGCILYRCIRDQYDGCFSADAVLKILGCDQ